MIPAIVKSPGVVLMGGAQSKKGKRGNTLLEILVAVGLLLLIFLFLTEDLIGSSQAENVTATHTEAIAAANYFIGVMHEDPNFWSPDWLGGNGQVDPCGNLWPAYNDSILVSSGWHPGPACTPGPGKIGAFPDLIGVPSFEYKWLAKTQAGDPRTAELTTWVMVSMGDRQDIYELHSTKSNISTPPPPKGQLPTPTPTPCTTNCSSVSPSPSPSVSHTPTPKPSPTIKPSPTPTPTPTPSGTFE